MPTYPLKALVLHKTKLGESDSIFTLLAADGSQVRAVAKGVRKPKSRFGGSLEPCSVVDLLLATGRSLEVICEVRVVETNEACRKDLEHSCAASVVCELLKKCSFEDQPQPILFDMASVALGNIGRVESERVPLLAAAFIIKVLSLTGYRPMMTNCACCGDFVDEPTYFSWSDGGVLCSRCTLERPAGAPFDPLFLKWVSSLISSTFADLAVVDYSPEIADDLLRFSQRWLIEHTGITLKSLGFMLRTEIA
ncbi:MAG: DNA repair protein RecO [Actinobacteria bacterium]|nr:DNA repair protein RecO [Actinomycetota bacterium]